MWFEPPRDWVERTEWSRMDQGHSKQSKVHALPLSRGELTLEASPRSVKEARRWAADVCHEVGREDLVDTAQMGISELVTNAILHGVPPIAVRMRGTQRFPRIEVFDGSRIPPAPNDQKSEDDLFSTFGRGLGMVAMCSHAWGAELLDSGKVVWFEPATEPVEEPDLSGQVFCPTDSVRLVAPRPQEGGTRTRFLHFPIDVFLDWRQHFRELRRELRLLTLAHEGHYPVAHTITQLFERFDAQIRSAGGIATLERAIASGMTAADIELVFGDDAPEVLSELAGVLDLADAFCREERLLSLASTDQQRDFQLWFVDEVTRQATGASPRPWRSHHTSNHPRAR